MVPPPGRQDGVSGRHGGPWPGAEALIRILGIRSGERVLVLADAESSPEPLAILAETLRRHGSRPEFCHDLPMGFAEELPASVESRMRQAEVIILAGSHSFYHTGARSRAKREWGKRVVECYGLVAENLAEGGLTADYQEVSERGERLCSLFQGAKSAQVLTDRGTDLSFGVKRAGFESGLYHEPGSGGNLPAGEVFLVPEPATARGRVVFDLSVDLLGHLDGETIAIEVAAGRITGVFGSQAPVLQAALAGEGRLAQISEVAFGTNPDARLGRNVLEDEKKFGTGHVGFGNDTYFGGSNGGPHYDGVFLHPTVILDGGRKVLCFRAEGSAFTHLESE